MNNFITGVQTILIISFMSVFFIIILPILSIIIVQIIIYLVVYILLKQYKEHIKETSRKD
jgi:hypothetical protein